MDRHANTRREGYAPTPANIEVGRRGQHTREAIVRAAARLFLDHGLHGTSIGAIAKAAGGSRATIYQYFEDKDAIYQELAARCAPALIAHSRQLGRLSADAEGLQSLHTWLQQWTHLFDEHAVALMDFAGQDSGSNHHDADKLTDHYIGIVTDRVREAHLEGIRPEDAAAAIVRVVYMVNLYRYRGMFGLRSASAVTASLTVAMQLLLFPNTPKSVLDSVPRPEQSRAATTSAPTMTLTHIPPAPPISPIGSDIVSAASALFAERGYFAVGMDDIAAAAEVSRRTLYRHFSTKVDILSELTQWAIVEAASLARDLHDLADHEVTRGSLHTWLGRYVRFHRSYGSVITTWYDGGLNTKLADAVHTGLGPFQAAAASLLARSGLPEGIERRVGAAIFLAVLGRMTDLTISRRTDETHYDTADLMLTVMTRMLRLDFTEH